MWISTAGPVFNSKSMTFQGVCLLGGLILTYWKMSILEHPEDKIYESLSFVRHMDK